MPVIQISNYYAQWKPTGSSNSTGTGRIILRNAANFGDIHYINDLSADDFRNLLTLLQTEKPIFWEAAGKYLRTAHFQSAGAEPVGEEET
jgi:hypothetical protein